LKVAAGGSSSQLTIYGGSALDVDGELIYISATQTLNRNTSTVNYNCTTTVGINYVKLSYIESSGSIKTNFSGVGFPTRYTASWYININSVIPTTDEILLATFTGDGSGNVTVGSIVDTRLYTRFYTFADAVGLDVYNIPVSTHTNVGDHIRATGSGTPSTNNPHGMSYSDISGSTTLLTALHATELHVNCIVPLLRTTACYNSYLGTVFNPTSNASISFTAPNNAFIVVNGIPISGSLTSLYAIDAYGIAGDGNYYAVVDNTGTTSWKSTLTVDSLFTKTVEGVTRYSTGHMNKDYYILGIATVADNGDDITLWQDSRIFYGTHQIDIGADYDEAVGDPNSGTYALVRGSTLIDNLLRMRYQLGKAINGTGSTTSWKLAAPPLTAGPASNGDPYHTHPSLLNTSFDYFVLENGVDQTIPYWGASYDTVEQYLNSVHIVKWERIGNNGFVSVGSTLGSGNVEITALQSGTYEIEYQLFVGTGTGSLTGNCNTDPIAMFSSGGIPVWDWAGVGDTKEPLTSISGLGTLLRAKTIVDLNANNTNYNKVIITANDFIVTGGSTPVNINIFAKAGTYNYSTGSIASGSYGGYGSWLKATLIKRA
jgi:hypothetical protein